MDNKVPRRGKIMSDELNQEAPASWEVPSEPEAPAVVEVVDKASVGSIVNPPFVPSG